MESRTTEVDGLTMRWKESGEGTPLVLVHGIPTNPDLWRHVIPRIEGARCLAWEMVGYGRSISEGRERPISVARQADYLLDWLDALGIERAILAGHDLGGGVVQITAVRRPERCAGLLLTNAIGYDSWPIPSVKAMRALGGLVARLPDAAFARVVRLFLLRGHDDRDRAREAFDHHFPPYEETDGAAAFVRQVRSLDVRDTLAVADDLPRIDVPARIAWGAADQFQKVEYGRRFARDLGAPLHEIEGGKHFTPEDHPEPIAEPLVELIDEVLQRERGDAP
ncbi:MAG: alpha/beta fold hydrolase [Gemmatimonadetes bacterium]|nr:alpha/beta fold hydrolase [Gemmatimonadota bacterium]